MGSMPCARWLLSVAVIPLLLPVLVSFWYFRACSHARVFLNVFGFNTCFRQRLVVICLDAPLLQVLHTHAGRFVRILVGKDLPYEGNQTWTSGAETVFR